MDDKKGDSVIWIGVAATWLAIFAYMAAQGAFAQVPLDFDQQQLEADQADYCIQENPHDLAERARCIDDICVYLCEQDDAADCNLCKETEDDQQDD